MSANKPGFGLIKGVKRNVRLCKKAHPLLFCHPERSEGSVF